MPEAPGQPASAVGRRPRWLRVLIAVGLSLVLVVGVALAAGVVLVRRYDQAVARDRLLAENARAGRGGAVTGPLNYLMLGSDALVGDPEAGQRSDTIIIAHVTSRLDHVYLVSIPRDLLVHIPPDPERNFDGDYTKINAAFEYGGGGRTGIQLLSRTLSELTGLRFDGAAVIDFVGLQGVVRELGGLNMCVDVRTESIHTGKVYEPGCRRMTPAEVLDYLRQRKSLPNGDYDRQRHQQQFLKAILDELLSRGILTNPLRLDSLLRALAGSLTVDLGEWSLTDLVFALRGLRADDMTGVSVPSEPEMIDDVSYVIADDTEAAGLYEALRSDTLDAWAAAHPAWVNQL